MVSPSYEELLAHHRQQQELLTQQSEMILFLQQEILTLRQEIHRLKNGGNAPPLVKPEPPAWVKPNVPPPSAENPPRKPRAQGFVRKRETPTEEVVHACSHCPDCGRTLSGGSEYSCRQIIELPAISVRVVDHLTVLRWCGIASLLSALCRLKVSTGEVRRMLATVAALGQSAYVRLQQTVRNSPFVHGDETGWRENGKNGYLWSFSTSDVAYFTYPKTRAGHVVTDVLGTDYGGSVVSDFYAGYNTHGELHQRCWVHLLRDVHHLKEKYPLPGVLAWAKQLRQIYDRAKVFSSATRKVRAKMRVRFQQEVVAPAAPFAQTCLPQSTLCKRLLQFESELFTCVEYSAVPSENNAAERVIRSRVIARKISGGTRSPSGSQTMAVLSSLFATWQLRGEECLSVCHEMLRDAQQQPLATSA